jgi:ATP-binding cassette subfamily C protein
MSRAMRQFIATLVEVARWKLAWSVLLMVAFSLTEGIGVVLLLPTLEVAGLNMTGQGAAGRYAALLRSALAYVGLPPSLLLLLCIYVVLLAARTLLGRAQHVAMYGIVQDLQHQLRTRLYSAISRADWLFVCRIRASDLTHALTAEIARVGGGVLSALQLAGALVLSALYVCLAFALSASMTALVLICGAILTFAMRRRTARFHERGMEIADSSGSLYSAATEHVESLKAAKAYGTERRNFAIFSDRSSEAARANLRYVREHASAQALFELGSVLITGAVLVVAVRILDVPPASLLILLAMFTRLMPRFLSGHHDYRSIINSLPSFTNVMELEAKCIAAAEPSDDSHGPVAFQRAVRLDSVAFAYPGGGAPAVRDVSLVIPAGGIVAIVGPSGAGKSTVVDLVMALITPDSGSVSVDGVVLDRRRTRAWREQLGYVAQETFLFHDTIRQNLLWARPDASDDDLWRALEMSAAAAFVRVLPAGLETVVGDRGILLSQGECQRLALARALVRQPALLVLDEATNSLDSDNEKRILGAIQRLRGELTVLLVAHRLSTVRWADLIYVVELGAVVESGAWDDLCGRPDGRFRALWEAQNLAD